MKPKKWKPPPTIKQVEAVPGHWDRVFARIAACTRPVPPPPK